MSIYNAQYLPTTSYPTLAPTPQPQPYHTHTHYDNSSHIHHHRSSHKKDKYFYIRRRSTRHARPSYDLIRTSHPPHTSHQAQQQVPYSTPAQSPIYPQLAYQQSPYSQPQYPVLQPQQQPPYLPHLALFPQPTPQHNQAAYPPAPISSAATYGSYSTLPISPVPSSSPIPSYDRDVDARDMRDQSARVGQGQNQRTHVSLNFPSTSMSSWTGEERRRRFLRVGDLPLAGEEEEDEVEELRRGVERLRMGERERQRAVRERAEAVRRLELEEERERERRRLWAGRGQGLRRYSVVVPERSFDGFEGRREGRY
ncbi:hypothetical protein C1H76_6671 [Elsinoe australis]|uniref:Uncharacterized protein n=1 Tax=Elsinoe australis TaxID=40998 RepID=A0A4U7AWU6_9PEZI|nr:hypothetical protein C1H76_6671 [Elsinoe australis]